jgi:hypothetical protein
VTNPRKSIPEHDGPDFPQHLWDDLIPKDTEHVQIVPYFSLNNKGFQDPEVAAQTPEKTNRFTFGADPAQLRTFPSFLQGLKKSGQWILEVWMIDEPYPAFRWKVYLGPSPVRQPGAPNVNYPPPYPPPPGYPYAPPGAAPPPGTWPYGMYAPTPITNGPSTEVTALQQTVQTLAAKLESQAQQTVLERLQAQYQADLERERQARKEDNERRDREAKEARDAHTQAMRDLDAKLTAKPPEKQSEWIQALPAILPVGTAIIGGIFGMMNASRQAHEESQRQMMTILTSNKDRGADTMVMQLMQVMQNQAVVDAKIMETSTRGQIEMTSMVANVLGEMQQSNPQISPIAEAAGRAISGITEAASQWMRSHANQRKALTAGVVEAHRQHNGGGNGKPDDAAQARDVVNYLSDLPDENLDAMFQAIKQRKANGQANGNGHANGQDQQHDAEPMDIDGLIKAKQVTPPVVAQLLRQFDQPQFITPEWIAILVGLHNQGDGHEVATLLADHLLHTRQFRMLPDVLKALDGEDDAEALDALRQMAHQLPIYLHEPKYVDAVVDDAFAAYWDALNDSGDGDDQGEDAHA